MVSLPRPDLPTLASPTHTHSPFQPFRLPAPRSGGHAHLIRPLLEGGSLGIHEPRGQVSAAARRQMGAPNRLPEDQCQGQTLLALAAGEDRVECLKASGGGGLVEEESRCAVGAAGLNLGLHLG